MSGMGERAYAYAKACGIIGRSFIGQRISSLENVNNLSELDRTIFPDAPQNLPEKELMVSLEDRIIDRAVNSIITIVECFSDPPEFLTLLVRSYEYEDLKNALFALQMKEKTAPAHTDIGRFQTVRFSAWPDIEAMIKGTDFEFLLEDKENLSKEAGIISLQAALDGHYYSALWKSLLSLPGKDRNASKKILSEEISLKNSIWALRLRSYYQMSKEEVKHHLIDIPVKDKDPYQSKPRLRSLADEALHSLEFSLDIFAEWSSWRWKRFLNPEPEGEPWQADPRYFQNAASRYLFRLARRFFHLHPSSLDFIFCFIKLKQFEEDYLTSGVEGLGMGMSGRDIVSMLGVVT